MTLCSFCMAIHIIEGKYKLLYGCKGHTINTHAPDAESLGTRLTLSYNHTCGAVVGDESINGKCGHVIFYHTGTAGLD